MARHLQGNRTPQVILYQGQAQVDPSGHAGRRPHRTLLDENRIGLHRERRELARQFFTARPVRGHATTIEQATGGQQKSPGANRSHAPGVQGFIAHPLHQRRVLGSAVHAPATGDHQGVAGLVNGGQRFGQQRQAG